MPRSIAPMACRRAPAERCPQCRSGSSPWASPPYRSRTPSPRPQPELLTDEQAQAGPACTIAAASTISGSILDSTQALIPGATLTLDNDRHATSTSDGRYRFPCVAPGKHHLTAAAEGFVPPRASTSPPPAPPRSPSPSPPPPSRPSRRQRHRLHRRHQLQRRRPHPDHLRQTAPATRRRPRRPPPRAPAARRRRRRQPLQHHHRRRRLPGLQRPPAQSLHRLHQGQPRPVLRRVPRAALRRRTHRGLHQARPEDLPRRALPHQRQPLRERPRPLLHLQSRHRQAALRLRVLRPRPPLSAAARAPTSPSPSSTAPSITSPSSTPSDATGTHPVANVATPQHLWLATARVGWQLAPRNTFIASYSANANALQNLGVGGTTLAEAGYDSNTYEHMFRASDITTFSAHLMHEARLSLRFNGSTALPNSTAPQVIRRRRLHRRRSLHRRPADPRAQHRVRRRRHPHHQSPHHQVRRPAHELHRPPSAPHQLQRHLHLHQSRPVPP